MIDVVNQFETGQEYMSRYQAVDPAGALVTTARGLGICLGDAG